MVCLLQRYDGLSVSPPVPLGNSSTELTGTRGRDREKLTQRAALWSMDGKTKGQAMT